MLKTFCRTLLLVSLSWNALAAPTYDQVKSGADKALARKDYATAIREFDRLIYLFPGRAEAHNALGYACFLDGRYEKAILQFRLALQLQPHLAAAQNNLLAAVARRALEQARDLEFSEAIGLLAATEKLYPSHPQALVLRFSQGQLQFFRGNEEGGLAVWKTLAARAPDSGSARFVQAIGLYRQGKLTEALAAMKNAQARLPEDPVVRNYMALILADLGKHSEALAHLQKAEKLDVPYIDLYLNHTAILLRMGKLEEALAQALKARELRPDFASVHLRLAAIYRHMGDLENSSLALGRAWSEQASPILLVTGGVGQTITVGQQAASYAPTGVYLTPGKHRLKAMTKGAAPQTQEFSVGPGQLALSQLPDLTMEVEEIQAALPPRKAAPSFALRDQNNRFWRSFQHFFQRPVVLLFWNVDSDGNEEMLQRVSELEARYQGKLACAVIHVGTEKKTAAISRMMTLPATYARLFDEGSVMRRYGLETSSLPNLMVVGTDGYLASEGQGSTGFEQAQAALEALLRP